MVFDARQHGPGNDHLGAQDGAGILEMGRQVKRFFPKANPKWHAKTAWRHFDGMAMASGTL